MTETAVWTSGLLKDLHGQMTQQRGPSCPLGQAPPLQQDRPETSGGSKSEVSYLASGETVPANVTLTNINNFLKPEQCQEGGVCSHHPQTKIFFGCLLGTSMKRTFLPIYQVTITTLYQCFEIGFHVKLENKQTPLY